MKKTENASHWTRHRSNLSVLRYHKTVKPKPNGVELMLRALGLSKRR